MSLDVQNKRILEIGCGLGLASLILRHRGADITATDVHPSAYANLAFNTRLNSFSPIPFIRADWKDKNAELGEFDLLVASDVLYQPDHPQLMADFVNRHSLADSMFIVVDPDRGNLAKFRRRIEPYGFTPSDPGLGLELKKKNEFRGQIQAFRS